MFTIARYAATPVAIALVLGWVAAAPAHAQGPPVTVNTKEVNAAADPVPVTGTVSVSILGNEPLPVRLVDSGTMVPFQAFIMASAW